VIDPADQQIADIVSDIGTLFDLLVPNEGDISSFNYGGGTYKITAGPTYEY